MSTPQLAHDRVSFADGRTMWRMALLVIGCLAALVARAATLEATTHSPRLSSFPVGQAVALEVTVGDLKAGQGLQLKAELQCRRPCADRLCCRA